MLVLWTWGLCGCSVVLGAVVGPHAEGDDGDRSPWGSCLERGSVGARPRPEPCVSLPCGSGRAPRTLSRQVVQKLTQMVGKNVKLYDMVLQFLRTLFLRTRNVHYCTLRAELLMSLHDLDVGDICTVDPCHKVCTEPTSHACCLCSC